MSHTERHQHDTNYRLEQLANAMEQRHPQAIAAFLFKYSDNVHLITSIPKSTWARILQQILTQLDSLALRSSFPSFNKKRLRDIGYSSSRYRGTFTERVISMIRIRRDHGLGMDIGEYRIMFSHIAKSGDIDLARVLWSEMKAAELRPDLECFNAYMQTIVWRNNALTPVSSRRKPPPTNATLPPDGSVPAWEEARTLMEQMRAESVLPDTKSYCIFLSAASQAGAFHEAESVLARAFGIDARDGSAQVSRGEEHAAYLPPNTRLLGTIAELFGRQNRIPTALDIIDQVSSNYNIPVTRNVWYALARWAWNQARIPTHERRDGSATRMRLTSVRKLGELMTAAPYSITPSLALRDILLRSSGVGTEAERASPRFPRLLHQMEMGRLEYIGMLKRFRALQARHRRIKRNNYNRHQSHAGPGSSATTHQKLINLHHQTKRSRVTLQRWARKVTLLKGIDFHQGPQKPEFDKWRTVGLPNFILQWNTLLPDTVKYRVATGMVELHFRTRAERVRQARRKDMAQSRKKLRIMDTSQMEEPWMLDSLTSSQVRKLPDAKGPLDIGRLMPPDVFEHERGMFEPSYESM